MKDFEIIFKELFKDFEKLRKINVDKRAGHPKVLEFRNKLKNPRTQPDPMVIFPGFNVVKQWPNVGNTSFQNPVSRVRQT